MILHTIISEYDVFRGQGTGVRVHRPPSPGIPTPKCKIETDPKCFINKKSRVN